MPALRRTGVLDGRRSPTSRNTCSRSPARLNDKAADERGAKIFADNCAACHGADGKGNPKLGAPNLTDELWLYAGDKQTIMADIRNGRGGVMPAWIARLDPRPIKELAIYVHSLGGGH